MDEAREWIEELRACDRELLGIQGDLENNWRQARIHHAPGKHRDGELRYAELEDSRALVDVIELRIDAALKRLRGQPAARAQVGPLSDGGVGGGASFSPIERASTRPMFQGLSSRHLENVHDELSRVHTLRHKLRADFERARADHPALEIAPLDSFEHGIDLEDVSAAISDMRAFAPLRYAASVVFGLVLIVLWFLRPWER